MTILDFKTKMQYGKVYISRPGNPMDLRGQGQRRAADVDALLREERQTLEGSFSAVSKRNFASKYAFESSRRDLHNALFCTGLQSQFFCQNFAKEFAKFPNLANV